MKYIIISTFCFFSTLLISNQINAAAHPELTKYFTGKVAKVIKSVEKSKLTDPATEVSLVPDRMSVALGVPIELGISFIWLSAGIGIRPEVELVFTR